MRKRIAITMGDAAGIGAEITVKALADAAVYKKAVPVVYGDRVPLEDALSFCRLGHLRLKELHSWEEAEGQYGTVEFFDAGLLKAGSWAYKKNQAESGGASFQYVVSAIRDAMEGRCNAVVTGPISKEAIHMAGHHYSGHTEIFAAYTRTDKYAMLLSGGAERKVYELAQNMTYLELSTTPGYMDEFVAACFIPHTNSSLFPSVSQEAVD